MKLSTRFNRRIVDWLMFDDHHDSAYDSGSTFTQSFISPSDYLKDEQKRDLQKVKAKRKVGSLDLFP